MNILMAYFENFLGINGGLEKVLCQFSNELVEKSCHVTIAIYDKYAITARTAPLYPLDPRVRLVNLNENAGKNGTPRLSAAQKIVREWNRLKGKEAFQRWRDKRRAGLISRFQELYDQVRPDVVIAYNHQTMGELYQAGVKCPVIAMFHSDPGWLCPQFTKIQTESINRAAAVQVLMPAHVETLRRYISNPHVVVIPNNVPQARRLADLRGHQPPYRILCAGRVNRAKRQDLLVKAFALLAADYPEWCLDIWGKKGHPYSEEIQDYIDKQGLGGQVRLLGVTDRMEEKYLASDIFCLPSQFEGFGLALAEAMSAGLPAVVCSDCATFKGLVREGEDGFFAPPTPQGLAAALQKLMDHRELRAAMSQKAHEAMKPYAPERVWGLWGELIQEVTAGK